MAQATSAGYRKALEGSPELVAQVEVLDADGNTIVSTHPDSRSPLTVAALSVSNDRARTIRGTASATVLVPDHMKYLIPTNASGMLAPGSGTTFRVRSGFMVDGQPELVPCGRYDIEASDTIETNAGVAIELSGFDLSARLNVEDLWEPRHILWGDSTLQSAFDLVLDVIPGIEFSFVPSGHTTPWIVLDEQSNRLTEIGKLMTSLGYEMWMDPNGVTMQMLPIPTTSDIPNWVYDEASLRHVGELRNQLALERIKNGAIVKAENVNSDIPPFVSVKWDTDPQSPWHYIPGPPVRTRIGPRPSRLTSQWISTQQQCNEACEAEFRRIQGLSQRVSLKAKINPAMNVGDVIHVDRPGLGVMGRYVVQSTSMRLDQPDWMDITCEERRV